MSATKSSEPRMYSGWRRRRGLGLFGLSPGESVAAVASILVLLMAVMFFGRSGLIFAGVPVVVLLLALVPVAGLPVHFYVRREVGFFVAGLLGRRSFRSGLIHLQNLDERGVAELPGALAATRLVEVDGLDGSEPWAIIWNQDTGTLTVSLAVMTQAAWLADPEDFDRWVSSWHQFIAASAFEPSLANIAVVADSKTIAGEVFADQLRASIVADAADFPATVMRDLAAREVRASTRVEMYVELTFDPAKGGAKGETIDGKAAEVARLIPGFEHSLRACGIGAVRRVSPTQMGRRLRVAFDPAAATSAEVTEAAGSGGLQWRSCGPVALDEERGALTLDSGAAVGFVWQEAPRSPVTAKVLAALLEAGPYAQRVTLMFVPTPAGLGAAQLESERMAAKARQLVRERQKVDETARAEVDRKFAEMAANEEALGAGLADMYMFAVVMAPKAVNIADAVAKFEHRAAESRIKMRRATCAHASVAAVGIGAGVFPPALARKGWLR